MSDEIAIRVENVSKDFVLPHEKVNSVKSLFTGITKRRAGSSKEIQHALQDISFEIKRGEFFGIVGRNGSGKSTMLKILANIYQPTDGKVYTAGKLVPFIELGVGFNPELTGRENVYLNGALLGFSEKEIDAMYGSIVEFAELERFMDQKLKNYSSGMQVRLAFSMAVRAEADILLIDEVLAVGDADFQRKCYEYFRKLKKTKKTVVFVSHDMAAVREFCDRAVLIEQSEILLAGDVNDVASRYTQLFIEGPKHSLKPEAGKKWGPGDVEISKVTISKNIFTDKDPSVELTVTLKAQKRSKYLMTGFQIRNSAGQLLHGTNSWAEHIELPELEPGKTCEVTWQTENIYSDDNYVVDVYTYGENNVLFEQWDEAATFSVKRQEKTPFLVSPSQKLTVKQKVR